MELNNGTRRIKIKKSYFEVKRSQKRRNRNLIRINSKLLSDYCNSIGLQIDEIKLSKKKIKKKKQK